MGKANKHGGFPASVSDGAGDVVQLVRTLPCHGRGRGFESRRPRHSFESPSLSSEVVVCISSEPRYDYGRMYMKLLGCAFIVLVLGPLVSAQTPVPGVATVGE